MRKEQPIGWKSKLLVLIQLASILMLFVLDRGHFLRQVGLLLLFVLAGTVGIHAIWVMRRYRLSVFPEARSGARLCKRGLYRWIRHPMYLSVLLACLSPTLSAHSPLSGILMGILLAVILMKIHIEERIWVLRKPEIYAAYMRESKRLIPLLY